MRTLRIIAFLLLIQPRPGLPAAPAGGIGVWVWHFNPALGSESATAYRDLLAALPRDVRVVVSVATEQAADQFEAETARAGDLDPRVRFAVTGRAVSAWARDRYLFLPDASGPRALLPLRGSVEPDRLGDLDVPALLHAFVPGLRVVQTAFAFEGGNVIVAGDDVIVGHDVVGDTAALTGRSPDVVRSELARVFRRRVVVIGDAGDPPPHDHIDMFLTVVGPREALLGDPALAAPGEIEGFGRRDVDPELPGLYARVAATLRRAGYRIARIPIVHIEGGKVVTWNNAVLERRGSRRIAYVPAYGLEALDRIARELYVGCGFRVRPVRARGVIQAGGAVRCLSNTLTR
ncbi:MAG: hypothetical protein ACYTGN_02615 [Planctomycetota bacterium]|jgi:hypothetical protein